MFYLMIILALVFGFGGLFGYYKDRVDILNYIKEQLKDMTLDKEVEEILDELGIYYEKE